MVRKGWIIATLFWMVFIFSLTQLPYFNGKHTSKAIQKVVENNQVSVEKPNVANEDINILNLVVRKSTHIFVFGILSVLLHNSFRAFKYSFILSWFLTCLYAITDEWHQSFVPGRVSTPIDVIFDAFGACIALFLVFIFFKRRRNCKVKNMA